MDVTRRLRGVATYSSCIINDAKMMTRIKWLWLHYLIIILSSDAGTYIVCRLRWIISHFSQMIKPWISHHLSFLAPNAALQFLVLFDSSNLLIRDWHNSSFSGEHEHTTVMKSGEMTCKMHSYLVPVVNLVSKRQGAISKFWGNPLFQSCRTENFHFRNQSGHYSL